MKQKEFEEFIGKLNVFLNWEKRPTNVRFEIEVDYDSGDEEDIDEEALDHREVLWNEMNTFKYSETYYSASGSQYALAQEVSNEEHSIKEFVDYISTKVDKIPFTIYPEIRFFDLTSKELFSLVNYFDETRDFVLNLSSGLGKKGPSADVLLFYSNCDFSLEVVE